MQWIIYPLGIFGCFILMIGVMLLADYIGKDCHHKFTNWKRMPENPSFQIRKCSKCGYSDSDMV